MRISSIIKTNLATTYKQGEMVRDKIIERLMQGKRITLDCGDITCMSFRFICPICDIYERFTEGGIKQNVRFVNTSRFQAEMLQRSFAAKKKLIQQKKERDEND